MENKNDSVEKIISISESHKLNKEIEILRPKISEAIYYLNREKYTVVNEIDYKKGIVKTTMHSPEKQWQGIKTYNIPKNNGAICYYHAIIECVKKTGFLNQAIDKNGGDMNLMLVWEGYPYFQEQFLNIPSTPVTDATLSYDGKNAGLHRFVLAAAGQSQFYLLDEEGKLVNHYWSSQAFSRTKR